MSKLEIAEPFTCCSHCEQRVMMRIDSHPTWHYIGNLVCPESIPKMLTFRLNQ